MPTEAPPRPKSAPRAIAHPLHTAALLLLLAGSTVLTHHRSMAVEAGARARPHLLEYGVSALLEWVVLGFVVLGIRDRRAFLRTSFRNRERTWAQSVGLGAMVYVLGMLAIALTTLSIYFTPLFHQRNQALVLALLPHTALDFAAWFGVSFTAGVCEELIFRGYLQAQLLAWLRRPALAIGLASLLFGSVHLYEGLGAVLPLTALAVVYGIAARRMGGDLRAVIVAHTLQDFLVAVLAALARFAQAHASHA